MSLEDELEKLRKIFKAAENLPLEDKDKAQVYFLLNKAMLVTAEVATDTHGKGVIGQMEDICQLMREVREYSRQAEKLDPTKSYRTTC